MCKAYQINYPCGHTIQKLLIPCDRAASTPSTTRPSPNNTIAASNRQNYNLCPVIPLHPDDIWDLTVNPPPATPWPAYDAICEQCTAVSPADIATQQWQESRERISAATRQYASWFPVGGAAAGPLQQQQAQGTRSRQRVSRTAAQLHQQQQQQQQQEAQQARPADWIPTYADLVARDGVSRAPPGDPNAFIDRRISHSDSIPRNRVEIMPHGPHVPYDVIAPWGIGNPYSGRNDAADAGAGHRRGCACLLCRNARGGVGGVPWRERED